jgi:hypothetical protein
VSLRVAPRLMLSTISPFLTNAAGTRVCAFTHREVGVRPLSAHHSQMARIRYGSGLLGHGKATTGAPSRKHCAMARPAPPRYSHR